MNKKIFLGLLSISIFSYSSSVLSEPFANPNILNPGVVTQYEIKRNDDLEQRGRQKRLEDEYIKQNEIIKLAPEKETANEEEIDSPKFTLNDVNFTGNRLISDSALKVPFKKIIGKEITFSELQSIIDEANKLYQDKGYITTRLNLPPQELGDDGVLKIDVIESRVGNIQVTNDRRMNENYIRNQIRPRRGDIFNIKDLERSLSRLNRAGHVRVVAKVVPGTKENTSDLVIDVSEIASLVQVVPQINNQGRPTVGFIRSGATLVSRSPLGIGDQLSVYGLGATKTAIAGAAYTLPVNSRGTYLGTSYDLGAINSNFGGSKLRGMSQIVSGFVGQEIVNRDNIQLNGEFGFQVKEPETRFAGIKIVDTPIRNLFQRLTLNQVDKWGATYGYMQANEGMNILGGKSEFFTINGEINRMQRFFDLTKLINSDRIHSQPSYFLFRAGGQMSSRPLPSIEQYQVGGIRTVRGYLEGALLNDIGQFSSIEYHFPIPMPTDKWNLDKRFELVGFIDQGSVKAFNEGWHGRNFLLGAGGGIRMRLSEFIGTQLDVGVPLANKYYAGSPADARVHFSVFMSTPTFWNSPWKKKTVKREPKKVASSKHKNKIGKTPSMLSFASMPDFSVKP